MYQLPTRRTRLANRSGPSFCAQSDPVGSTFLQRELAGSFRFTNATRLKSPASSCNFWTRFPELPARLGCNGPLASRFGATGCAVYATLDGVMHRLQWGGSVQGERPGPSSLGAEFPAISASARFGAVPIVTYLLHS